MSIACVISINEPTSAAWIAAALRNPNSPTHTMNSMNPRLQSHLLTIALLASLAPLASLHADSATWDGDTDAAWNILTNWDDPAAVPGSLRHPDLPGKGMTSPGGN